MSEFKTMHKKSVLRFLKIWLPVIIMMGVIFYFSAQDSTASNAQSDPVADLLLRLGLPDALRGTAVVLVRKGGHLFEYALLGAALCRAFVHSGASAPVRFAAAAGYVYACTDELHQLFVPGRSGQFTDTLIDGTGIVLGVLICRMILNAQKNRLSGGFK